MVLVRVHGYGVTDLTPLKALSRAQGQALMEKIRVKIAGKRNVDQGHNPARLLQQVLLSTLVQLPKPDTVPALQTTPSSTRGAVLGDGAVQCIYTLYHEQLTLATQHPSSALSKCLIDECMSACQANTYTVTVAYLPAQPYQTQHRLSQLARHTTPIASDAQ
ncbi:TPA: hypothetical protein ACH3X1_008162 [Trebouxia sp. C0004]